MTVAAMLVRVMMLSARIFPYRYYHSYPRWYYFDLFWRFADGFICIPVFIVIGIAGIRVGNARGNSDMIPSSLHGLGRQGDIHLS